MSIYIKIIFLKEYKEAKFPPEKQRWLAKNFNVILIVNVDGYANLALRRERQILCVCVCVWCTGFLLRGGGYSSIYISASNICVCFSRALLIPKGTINAAEITRDLMFSWHFSVSIPRWKYHENTRSRVILAP